MEDQVFRTYLLSLGHADKDIETQITFITNLESFLKEKAPGWSLGDINSASVQALVDDLIDRGQNSLINLLSMLRYAKAIDNQEMFITVFQMLDGYEAMEGLHQKLSHVVGEELRDIIFEDLPLPPLGLSRREKALYTYRIMTRLDEILEERTCREILGDCLRDLPASMYADAKKEYFEVCNGNMDHFLIHKKNKFMNTLREYKERGELFFCQEITDTVISFVEDNQEMGGGVRVGNIVYETKIPYNTKAYLEETDPAKRQYHYCHCPWAKESLRKGVLKVPATFCQCSAGFHKKIYEAIFEEPLNAVVIKSILNGDSECRFAIYLPETFSSVQ